MKHLRIQILVLISWLIVFYSFERLFNFIEISQTAYIANLMMVVVVLIVPFRSKTILGAAVILSMLGYVGLKASMGVLSSINAFLLSMFETLSIGISALLVYWMNISLGEFASAVAKITIGRRDRLPESAAVGQGYMYREVRRARNFNRPLTLMAVSVDDKRAKRIKVDRMVQEAQQAMIKQYQLAGVSKLLCDQLDDCAIIVQSDNRFLVALPETKPEEMPYIIERLRRQVSDHFDAELDIGMAAFPKDSYTLEGLLDKATAEMKVSQEVATRVDLGQFTSEKVVVRK